MRSSGRRDGVGGATARGRGRRGATGGGAGQRHLEHAKRLAIRIGPREQRHRYVVDRDAVLGLSLELAAMRVPVDDERYRVSSDRLLETARAEERIDLERLTLHRLLNR